MVESYLVGVVQMNTQSDKRANVAKASQFIKEAADKGAKLVALPEYFNCMGENTGEGGNAESIPGYTSERLSRLAADLGVWIHCGSIAEENPDGGNPFNTTILMDDTGKIRCRYRKLHMFDVDLPNGVAVRESETKSPGNEIVTFDGELGHFGFSICYDIRFPEIYRVMAERGAEIFFTPSNFTLNTGKDHWESILRCRAIENTCYVVAPAQIGKKSKFDAFGKSMVVDPWGTVIAKAKDKEGIVLAEIDMAYLREVRGQVPSLKNRRTDLYTIAVQNR